MFCIILLTKKLTKQQTGGHIISSVVVTNERLLALCISAGHKLLFDGCIITPLSANVLVNIVLIAHYSALKCRLTPRRIVKRHA